MTGVVSALTLGMVPDTLGSDLVEVDSYKEQGWSKATLELIEPHSSLAYKNTKTIILIFEVLIAFLLATRYTRKRS